MTTNNAHFDDGEAARHCVVHSMHLWAIFYTNDPSHTMCIVARASSFVCICASIVALPFVLFATVRSLLFAFRFLMQLPFPPTMQRVVETRVYGVPQIVPPTQHTDSVRFVRLGG